jgi:hypothetical protein
MRLVQVGVSDVRDLSRARLVIVVRWVVHEYFVLLEGPLVVRAGVALANWHH